MIQFRFYDKNSNKMVYGALPPYYYENPNIKVMRGLGIKDKKDVDIYEGDYLVDYCPIDEEDESKGMYRILMPVVWCTKTLQWCIDASFSKDGEFLISLVEYFGKHLEVKGNIYDPAI